MLTKRKSNEKLKCPYCGIKAEWHHVKWLINETPKHETAVCLCYACEEIFTNKRIRKLSKIFLQIKDDVKKCKDFIVNELGEEWIDHKKN